MAFDNPGSKESKGEPTEAINATVNGQDEQSEQAVRPDEIASPSSELGLSDNVLDNKIFSETFANNAKMRELDPEKFSKSVDQLKEWLNSPDVSQEQKLSLLQGIAMNPENGKSYAIDVQSGKDKLTGTDVVTAEGRKDILNDPDGAAMDKLMAAQDLLKQALDLSIDQYIVNNRSDSGLLYMGKIDLLSGSPSAHAGLLKEPEIKSKFDEYVNKATDSMPQEAQTITRFLAAQMVGDSSDKLIDDPIIKQLEKDLSTQATRPANELVSVKASVLSMESAYALAPEHQQLRKSTTEALKANPPEGKEKYDEILEKLRNTQ